MYKYIHPGVCLMTGPPPLPQPVVHTVRSSASSFTIQYPLFSLRSCSSCLCHLPRLPVTYILPSILTLITRWYTRCSQLRYTYFSIIRTMFLSLLPHSNISSFLKWSVQLLFSIPLQHHISKLSAIPKCPSFRNIQSCAPNVAFRQFIS